MSPAKRGAIGVAYLRPGRRVNYGTFIVNALHSPEDLALVAGLKARTAGDVKQALGTMLFRHLDDVDDKVVHYVGNALLDAAGADYWAVIECKGDSVGEAQPLGVNSPEEMCAWVDRNMPGIAGRVVEDMCKQRRKRGIN
jgi:hypothetical protein